MAEITTTDAGGSTGALVAQPRVGGVIEGGGVPPEPLRDLPDVGEKFPKLADMTAGGIWTHVGRVGPPAVRPRVSAARMSAAAAGYPHALEGQLPRTGLCSHCPEEYGTGGFVHVSAPGKVFCSISCAMAEVAWLQSVHNPANKPVVSKGDAAETGG